MRSQDANACCMFVKRSEMSRTGQKKRCMYCRNAISVPSVMASSNAAAAVPDDGRGRHGVEQHHGRLERGVVERGAQVGAEQPAVALVEATAGCAAGG